MNSVGGQDLMGGVGVLVRGGVGVGVGRRGVFGGKGRKGDGWYVRGRGWDTGWDLGFVWWGGIGGGRGGGGLYSRAFVVRRLTVLRHRDTMPRL